MNSLHEIFLRQTFYGLNVFCVLGLFVTMGIVASCICRLAASPPSILLTTGQALHLYLLFWSLESFVDLLFFQYFAGHDIAFGVLSILYLHSTRRHWKGTDCVIDFIVRCRQRLRELRHGIPFGRHS
jgi:hypothetical protein